MIIGNLFHKRAFKFSQGVFILHILGCYSLSKLWAVCMYVLYKLWVENFYNFVMHCLNTTKNGKCIFCFLTLIFFIYFFESFIQTINESSWSKHVLPPMLSHKDRLYLKMNQVD